LAILTHLRPVSVFGAYSGGGEGYAFIEGVSIWA
jgi:hypothetical protein